MTLAELFNALQSGGVTTMGHCGTNHTSSANTGCC